MDYPVTRFRDYHLENHRIGFQQLLHDIYDSFVTDKETTDDRQKGHSFHTNFLQWPRGSPTFFFLVNLVFNQLCGWVMAESSAACIVSLLTITQLHHVSKNHKNTQNSNFGVGLVSLSVLAALPVVLFLCRRASWKAAFQMFAEEISIETIVYSCRRGSYHYPNQMVF